MTNRDRDPLWEIGRNDPCWCGAPSKYKRCHGDKQPRSQPGAEVPPDTDQRTFLSPTTAVASGALGTAGNGAPMYMPSERPKQRPLAVPAAAVEVATVPPRSPSLGLAQLGQLRFEILDALGLTDSETVEARVSDLSDADTDSLRYGILDLTKATIDTLHEQMEGSEPPTAIWVDTKRAVDHMIGSTMLWADHYLFADPVAEFVFEERSDITAGLLDFIRLRPLIEAGVAVPVSRSVAAATAGPIAVEQTAADLTNEQLVDWTTRQLIIEGPTAKEVLLFEIADDYSDLASFYLLGHTVDLDESDHTFRSVALQAYRSDHDYGPWIEQSKRQTVAKVVQELNLELAIATSLGAEYVSRTPFRARFLEMRGGAPPNSQHLIWARVPRLSNSSPSALAEAVSTSNSVEALRHRVRLSFQEMRGKTPAERRQIAADLRSQLQYEAGVLQDRMRADRRWEVLVPTGLAITTLTLGAVTGAPALGSVSGLLAAAAGLAPRITKRSRDDQFQPAYAVVLGDGSVPPRPSHPSVSSLQDFDVDSLEAIADPRIGSSQDD